MENKVEKTRDREWSRKILGIAEKLSNSVKYFYV